MYFIAFNCGCACVSMEGHGLCTPCIHMDIQDIDGYSWMSTLGGAGAPYIRNVSMLPHSASMTIVGFAAGLEFIVVVLRCICV